MLAQKLILSYSSKIVVQIIQIIASIVVARIAGPTVLGTVTFGLSYVTIFTFIADLGFGTAYIKSLFNDGQQGDDFRASSHQDGDHGSGSGIHGWMAFSRVYGAPFRLPSDISKVLTRASISDNRSLLSFFSSWISAATVLTD